MPDKKITQLVDGSPVQPTDEFVVARAGDNFKIDAADVVAAVTKHDVTLAGNTAGVLALVSSGTMTLAGGNNVTLSQAGNAITISGAAAGGAQTAISGLANSQTTYTSGTVSLSELGGITIRSSTGQIFQFQVPATSSLSATGAVSISINGSTISIGAPAQTEQTQNVVDVTLSGNTSGALALVSSGTLTLAGGNNITLSQAGNAVTISGPNAGGAQTGISGIANSETTYTSGTVSLSELGAITIRSTTGNQFQLSVNAQSVQPETQTFIAGVSASDTLYTSGNVRITGVGGGITVSSNTGQRIDLSVAAQSVQPETQTFIAGISASDTLYTSGNVRISGSQAVTVRSGTGQLVIVDAPAQTNQSGGVYASSNTFGTSSGTYDARSISIAGRGAVSIAASNSGWIISAPTQTTQVETQTFIAGVSASDTLYTSGNVRITGVGGGVTVSSNTGQRVDISVAAPVAATNLSVGVSTGGNTLGDTGVATGSRFVIVGSNGITASQGTAAGATTVTLSGITQTVQTQGGFVSLGVSTGGNTVGNTQVSTGSRFVLVASGNATASQATAAGASTVTISVGTQTVQTQNLHNVTLSGNTAGAMAHISSGTLTLAGGNNITLSQAGNAVTISAPNLGAGAFSGGVSTGGNTAGATGVTGTRMVFVGTNNITLSQTTDANGGTMSISGPASSSLSAVGTGITITPNGSTISFAVPGFEAGVSTGGNTAGATGMTATRIVFVGSNNISLSQTTGAAGATITINQSGAAGGFSGGVSTGGNTAGATGITGSQNVFVGVTPISLSQTTGANGGTISINAPATSSLSGTGAVEISTNGSTISIGVPAIRTMGDWQNFPMALGVLMTHVASISKTPFYWNNELPARITANNFVVRLSAVTTATLQSFSIHAGIYTFVNSTSAALLGSWSETYVLSTASSASWSGVRNYVMTGIGTHTALSVLTGGDYMFGLMFSAGAAGSMAQSLYGAGSVAGPLGRIVPGVNQASTGTSQGVMQLHGRGSTTVNALPANVVASEIVNQGSGASMQLHPWVYIRS